MASQINKKLIKAGNGKDYPRAGDEVIIEYTGWLHDPAAAANNNKGTKSVPSDSIAHQNLPIPLLTPLHFRFDSSVGRGDFKTKIGVGRVIPGMTRPPI